MSLASRMCVAVHNALDKAAVPDRKELFSPDPCDPSSRPTENQFQRRKKTQVGAARDRAIDQSGGINIAPC